MAAPTFTVKPNPVLIAQWDADFSDGDTRATLHQSEIHGDELVIECFDLDKKQWLPADKWQRDGAHEYLAKLYLTTFGESA